MAEIYRNGSTSQRVKMMTDAIARFDSNEHKGGVAVRTLKANGREKCVRCCRLSSCGVFLNSQFVCHKCLPDIRLAFAPKDS